MGQSSGNVWAQPVGNGPGPIGSPVQVVPGPDQQPSKGKQFAQNAGSGVLSGIANALSGQQAPVGPQGFQPPINYGQQPQMPMFSAYNYPGGGGFYGGM